MSEPWEKGPKSAELPNPELNPLENPTLGRNLGRWAQVYFTSPPEKREQAVVDLLRELKTETDPGAPAVKEGTQSMGSPDPHLLCPFCEQPNDPAHKFCGQCGSPLEKSRAPVFPKVTELRPVEASVQPIAEPSATAEPAAQENDLEWLREKSLSRLSDPDEPSGKWKYVLLALALVVFAFAILQWLSNRPSTLSPQSAVSAPAVTQQPNESSTPAEKPTLTQDSPPITQPAQGQPSTVGRAKTSPTKSATNSPVPEPDKPAQANQPTPSVPEGGSQELYLAQGYLNGKHGARDSAEAAKWLWKAVAKENSTADVLLADLYLSGDGVSKSCTQARLLLVAAVQKGQPAAAEKLRGLESGGCR